MQQFQIWTRINTDEHGFGKEITKGKKKISVYPRKSVSKSLNFELLVACETCKPATCNLFNQKSRG